jgi:hypothetical protein
MLAVLLDRFEFTAYVSLWSFRSRASHRLRPEGQEIIGRSALVTRPFLKDDLKAGSQLPLLVKLAA